MVCAGMEIVELSATLIFPETAILLEATIVPFKLRSLPNSPVLVSFRVLFSAISAEPESVFPFAIFNSVSAEITRLLTVPDPLTCIPFPALDAVVT